MSPQMGQMFDNSDRGENLFWKLEMDCSKRLCKNRLREYLVYAFINVPLI